MPYMTVASLEMSDDPHIIIYRNKNRNISIRMLSGNTVSSS